jgi:DNA-binding NarL/FixJ family response regulator
LKNAIDISTKLDSFQAFKEFEMLDIKILIDEFKMGNQQLKSILKSNKIDIGINFSKREQEIINHILNGDSNAQIAEKLYLSEGTVKWHISNIYKKANCKNRSSLIKLLK